MLMMNSFTVAPEDNKLLSMFPEALQMRCKMHNIMIASTAAILKAIQDATINPHPNFLSQLISLFDSQYLDIFRQCQTSIGVFHAVDLNIVL